MCSNEVKQVTALKEINIQHGMPIGDLCYDEKQIRVLGRDDLGWGVIFYKGQRALSHMVTFKQT